MDTSAYRYKELAGEKGRKENRGRKDRERSRKKKVSNRLWFGNMILTLDFIANS